MQAHDLSSQASTVTGIDQLSLSAWAWPRWSLNTPEIPSLRKNGEASPSLAAGVSLHCVCGGPPDRYHCSRVWE